MVDSLAPRSVRICYDATGLPTFRNFFIFIKLSKAISGSTGPIFTIFHQMEGICMNVANPD